MPREYGNPKIEADFFRFLISRYGLMGAFALRAEYTFRDITQSPAWKEWDRLGRPADINEIPQEKRGAFQLPQENKTVGRDTGMENAVKTPEEYAAETSRASKIEQINQYRAMFGLEPATFTDETTDDELKTMLSNWEDRYFDSGKWQTKEDEGVSPNTQAQLDYYRERDASELERQRLANEQAVYNFETNRLANLSNIGVRPDTGEAEKAKLWDEWRNTFLSEMKDNPRSWINYNELVTRSNPYAPPKEDLVGAVKSAQEQAKTYDQMAKEAEQIYNDIAKRVTDRGGTVGDTELISAKRRYDTLVQYRDSAKNYSESYGQTGQKVNQETGEIIPMSSEERAAYVEEGKRAYQDDLSQPETSVVSRGVAIPSWLPTYVSGLRNKQYLPGTGTVGGEKIQANPLSGQALSRMSDTQRQMLYGYLDYTGQSIPDYLQTTQRQLPQSPTRTSGWTPYRQV